MKTENFFFFFPCQSRKEKGCSLHQVVCVVVEFHLIYSPPSLGIHDRPSLAFFFVSSTDVHLIQRRNEKEKYRTQEFTSSKERVPVDFLSTSSSIFLFSSFHP